MSDDTTLRCAQCGNERFPEGIGVVECRLCEAKMHPGCANAHSDGHEARGDGLATFRRGTMGAHGIIRWREP